jgi:hypothetical protein
VALATATELDFVSLPDALELVLLLVDDPGRFRRATLRWHTRYCGGFEEAQAVLAELVHRRGLERASEVLLRWGDVKAL